MKLKTILPLLLLGACTGIPDGVTPINGFDSARYLGTWYEIKRLDHRFERGLDNVTATYSARDDGKLDVLNRGLKRDTCEWDEAKGVARFLGARDVGSLGVTFQWPFEGGYHILALDKENYGWALVSGPDRGYLWILSRTPALPAETLQMLEDKARSLDYPVDELITVKQDAPPCPA